jgi:hypothetical protein
MNSGWKQEKNTKFQSKGDELTTLSFTRKTAKHKKHIQHLTTKIRPPLDNELKSMQRQPSQIQAATDFVLARPCRR